MAQLQDVPKGEASESLLTPETTAWETRRACKAHKDKKEAKRQPQGQTNAGGEGCLEEKKDMYIVLGQIQPLQCAAKHFTPKLNETDSHLQCSAPPPRF